MQIDMKSQSFWAIVLIVLGVILLAGNPNVVIALLLIAVGAGLIFARPSVQEARFSEPLGSARAAHMDINLPVGEAAIQGLRSSDNLIEADLTYLGSVAFDATGEEEKHIRLRQNNSPTDWLNNLFGWIGINKKLCWNIGLSPAVPTDLRIQGGAGKAYVDLSDVQLTGLWMQGGVGELDVTLPAPDDHYQARIKGGVGEITIKIASGADLDLEVGGGVGELHVELPPDAAVRLRAHTGIGEVKVPRRLTRIEGSGQPFGGSGVWETADYASAARKITIEAQGGVGELHFS